MNFQWILLALFLISLVRNVFKAMRNPMIKNVLRLISIPIAFLITYLLQMNGVFQLGIEALLDWAVESFVPVEYVEMLGEGIHFVIPFLCTVLGAFIFSLAFHLVLWILELLHVNLVYSYIMNRKHKKEIEEFRASLEEEKKKVKDSIRESEKKRRAALEEDNPESADSLLYEYKPLDDDEIERLVEERVAKEKAQAKIEKKKKMSFFKENSNDKATSILAGIASGFLLFAISWMGMFYTMDVLSEFTAGIKNTEANEGKVYRIVELVDEYAVKPYEESFIYEIYDSVGFVDLMNDTIRLGGKIESSDGTVSYADDIMRKYTRHSVRLVCEITDTNINNSHFGEDIEALTKEPVMVSFMAKAIVFAVEKFEESNPDFFESLLNSDPEAESDLMNSLLSKIVGAYRTDDGEWSEDSVKNDINAIIDVVVIAADNKLLSDIIAGTMNTDSILENREMIKDMAGALSGVSFYGPLMETAFTFGVDMIAPMLGLPANDAEAYETFINKISTSLQSIDKLSDEDFDKLQDLFMNADQYRINDGKISYVVGKIERKENKISENNALIAEKEALISNPETTEEDKELLNNEIENLKNQNLDLQEEIESIRNEQLNPLYAEREAAELAGEKTSILDYLLDSIYVIDIIQEDGAKLKESGDLLVEKSNELQEHAASLEKRAQELKDKSNELTELQNNLSNLTEEQKARLQKLLDEQNELAESGKDFITLGNELAAEGEALAKEAEELADEGNKLLDDGRALADDAAAVMDAFQARFEGFSPFVTYFMTWMNVQKPFMLAGEDTSTACMALYIGDELYVCNTDILDLKTLLEVVKGFTGIEPDLGGDILNPDNTGDSSEDDGDGSDGDSSEGEGGDATDEITDKLDDFLNIDIDEIINQINPELRNLLDQLIITNDTSDMDNSVSDLTELVDYLINKVYSAEATVDEEWLIASLEEFIDSSTVDKSKNMAVKIVNAYEDHSTFDYLGITAESMNNALCFDERWTAEAKKADTKVLVDIIFSLLDIVENMSGENAEESVAPALSLDGVDTTQIDSILSLLVTLGETMDKMAETTCLHGLPHVLIESILKNDMLSVAMTPTMLYGENGYMSRIDSGDINYKEFMEELVETVTDLLGALTEEEEDAV